MTLLAFWPNKRWWMPGKFCHVTVLERTEETWVEIDIGRQRAEVHVYWRKADVDDRLSRIAAECTILSYDRGPGRCFGVTMTCVTFARHYTGVPSRALLPDRLLRDLLRNGAEVVHEPRHASGIERADPEPASGRRGEHPCDPGSGCRPDQLPEP